MLRHPFALFFAGSGCPPNRAAILLLIDIGERLRKTRPNSWSNASAKLGLDDQRRLPPLNAVRAFEAAARRGGFQAAGAELNVSANAVGRLVKVLEDWLGVALFRRLPRGVVVTAAGRCSSHTFQSLHFKIRRNNYRVGPPRSKLMLDDLSAVRGSMPAPSV